MALMPYEAPERGVESNPTALAGPVAHPILHRWRQVNASKAGLYAEEPDDSDPYTALATRERMIREDLGHDTAVLCSETLAGCVAYLESVLTDLARDPMQALVLDDLIDTARRLRARLDADLRNQHGPERGAPCPECGEANLVKRYDESDHTGASDTWRCPACRQWWSDADYRLRVADAYVATADRLTLPDMEVRTGIPGRTLRHWVLTGQVESCGRRQSDGKRLYRVADIETRRGRVSVATEVGK